MITKKIIFLDIDGVLNNQLHYTSDYSKELNEEVKKLNNQNKHQEGHRVWELSNFCPRNVEILNQLIKETDAYIVVSSTWRKNRSVEELQDLFDEVGIEGEIIGKTPVLYFNRDENVDYQPVPRGSEIKAWMDSYSKNLGKSIKIKYIILDDDSDMLYSQRNNFILTDPYVGLTTTLKYRAKKILNS